MNSRDSIEIGGRVASTVNIENECHTMVPPPYRLRLPLKQQMFPWRLSRVYCLSLYRRQSFLLRGSRFKVGNRKNRREILRPCSVKRLKRTSQEKENISNMFGDKISERDEIKSEEVFHEFPGIPVVPSTQGKKPGVIFVFEKASLVPALVGKTYQILNAEDHANFLRRKKMDPYSYRPDIIFEALLELTDSNLYKDGRVQAIYVKTDQGVLIRIEPNTRLPRTFGSFCTMMLQLLQKLSTNAKGKRGKLLRLVKNPVTQHLPVNSLKIGLSYSSQKVLQLKDYVGAISHDVNLVFVVGAMAHGKIDCEYADDIISVSEYPLSAVCCIRRIYRSLERKFKASLERLKGMLTYVEVFFESFGCV